VRVQPGRRPDPLTDPLPPAGCQHPVVYVSSACCHHPPQQPPKVNLAPFFPPPPPKLNGHVVPTQILPTVKGRAPVNDPDLDDPPARHRIGDDDEGLNMRDMLLGALVGAGLAIFVIGLLLVWLVG